MRLVNMRSIAQALAVLALIMGACNQQEETGSMHPTEGYPFTNDIQAIRETLRHKAIDTIDFQPGEIIADIGAGNGYIEAMLSIFHDSLVFYIQDLDDSVCNYQSFKKVQEFYQEVGGKEFQNEFRIVIGTDTETNLPDNTFDKILMLWTYQYLKSPLDLVEDIRENLKNDGLFYVVNPQIEEGESARSLREKYGWNVAPIEKQISDIIDCGFDLVRISKNYETEDYNQPLIMVFKKRL